MHPIMKTALETAEAIMKDLTADADVLASERARLQAMSKEELVEELLALTVGKRAGVKVEELAYAVLCTPECAALSCHVIATLIQKHRPGSRTTANNISHYISKASERGYDVVPRIQKSEQLMLLMYEEK